ncbi:MAG: DUF4258 domain-containing protein [Caldilineales bacterium]|nr:DUF4258 domain-containing protein [Caldilineales bacterium]
MEFADKQSFIRRISAENEHDPTGSLILWSRHAVAELVNEGWQRRAVEVGLSSCEVIEDYPSKHRPLPDCLVFSTLSSGEPFHAVVALDEDNARLLIVTIYHPSREEWENDWKTRRK